MEDPEDPDLGPHDLVHHPIVPDAELPISLQGPLQGLPIPLRGRAEAGFDGAGHSTLDVEGDRWQILLRHLGMVDEGIGHSAPRLSQVGPDFRMGQGLLAVEGLLPILGEPGQDLIFLGLHRRLDHVSHLQREGDPIPLGPPTERLIQGFFQDDVHPGILRRHVLHLPGEGTRREAPRQAL